MAGRRNLPFRLLNDLTFPNVLERERRRRPDIVYRRHWLKPAVLSRVVLDPRAAVGAEGGRGDFLCRPTRWTLLRLGAGGLIRGGTAAVLRDVAASPEYSFMSGVAHHSSVP